MTPTTKELLEYFLVRHTLKVDGYEIKTNEKTKFPDKAILPLNDCAQFYFNSSNITELSLEQKLTLAISDVTREYWTKIIALAEPLFSEYSDKTALFKDMYLQEKTTQTSHK